MRGNILIGKNKIRKSTKLLAFNYIENSVIGKNCRIFGCKISNCTIGDNVTLTDSVLQDSEVGNNCSIGPFSYIREGAVIEDDCRIGDFVEIKKSRIGQGTKSAHLAYIGDADVGEGCNIGCGCIFANYNGKIKQKISIGHHSFIGANVNLVAPLEVGEQCYVGAGTTVRDNLADFTFLVAETANKNGKNKWAV